MQSLYCQLFKLWAMCTAAVILPAAASESVSVFVSVLPQKYFVEKVGGEHVEVGVMVGSGQNPHSYEPTPKQMAALAEAQLYVRTGVAFESVWMPRMRAVNPTMKVVDARQGIDLRPMVNHDHDHHDEIEQQPGHRTSHDQHEHKNLEDDVSNEVDEYDPHIWTAPPLVAIMAARIRDALSALDPAHRADYEANYAAFVAELTRLDEDIRRALKDKRQRQFMVFHPAWGYFANSYDLVQISIEAEGKQPGAKRLAQLIDQARDEDIRIIFVQQQLSRREAEAVARAIDGQVVTVDPLAYDYLDNMHRVAAAFAEVLR